MPRNMQLELEKRARVLEQKAITLLQRAWAHEDMSKFAGRFHMLTGEIEKLGYGVMSGLLVDEWDEMSWHQLECEGLRECPHPKPTRNR